MVLTNGHKSTSQTPKIELTNEQIIIHDLKNDCEILVVLTCWSLLISDLRESKLPKLATDYANSPNLPKRDRDIAHTFPVYS